MYIDQTPQYAASDQGLHCLFNGNKKFLKIIYKGSFKSFVALYADRICSDQHFVENCIEEFPFV